MPEQNNSPKRTEANITCCKKKCGKKFTVKLGKNSVFMRTDNCPYCSTVNLFSMDENGKVHNQTTRQVSI